MSLLQIVAAALVTVGSALVLRAVWLSDVGAPVDAEPQESEARTEWREAA